MAVPTGIDLSHCNSLTAVQVTGHATKQPHPVPQVTDGRGRLLLMRQAAVGAGDWQPAWPVSFSGRLWREVPGTFSELIPSWYDFCPPGAGGRPLDLM